MAAIWADRVMNVPAEAAQAPLGATKAMTGTSAFIIVSTIFSVEVSNPPGVFISIMQAVACASSASLMPLIM